MNITEWRAQNEVGRYPFTESSTMTAANGSVIPNDCIVDMIVFCEGGVQAGAYLSSLLVSGTTIIGTLSQSDTVIIGSFIADYAALNGGTVNILTVYGKPAGRIVFGRNGRDLLRNFQIGNTALASDIARVESSCMVSLPTRVVSLEINTQRKFGKIALLEGNGIVITKTAGDQVKVSAIGSRTSLSDCCRDKSTPLAGLTIEVNGTSYSTVPNIYGGIVLESAPYSEPKSVDDNRQLLRFTPSGNALTISLAL
jgi:hypothetical protein